LSENQANDCAPIARVIIVQDLTNHSAEADLTGAREVRPEHGIAAARFVGLSDNHRKLLGVVMARTMKANILPSFAAAYEPQRE
jgi:hypothetical protein